MSTRTQQEIEAHSQAMAKAHTEKWQALAGSVPPSIDPAALPDDPARAGIAIENILKARALRQGSGISQD